MGTVKLAALVLARGVAQAAALVLVEATAKVSALATWLDGALEGHTWHEDDPSDSLVTPDEDPFAEWPWAVEQLN